MILSNAFTSCRPRVHFDIQSSLSVSRLSGRLVRYSIFPFFPYISLTTSPKNPILAATMSTCSTCLQSISPNAQFCHNCGSSQSDSECSNCEYKNPRGWVRCENCGLSPGMTSENTQEYDRNFIIDFREIPKIQTQIQQHFNEYLNQKTKEEFGTEKMCDYLTIFKESDYPHEVGEMTYRLAEQAYTIHCQQDEYVQTNIDELLLQNFASVVDEFFLSYCYNDEPLATESSESNEASTNHPTPAPTTIPQDTATDTRIPVRDIDAADLPLPGHDRGADIPAEEGQPTDQYPVVRDVAAFFDAENSPYKIYIDLNQMPSRILDEVKKNFLFNAPEERVLLVYDDTVFGSGSTGFALTEHAIYWKTHFQNAQRTYFQEIMNLEMDGSKLEINNIVFDIDAAVNYKVYEYLKGKAFAALG